ncbi:M23 family metallopeptidase [Rickettsiales endosymbiont of Stachyamoeba lipophora]|uniref:M23 family metallopeptidase n=1 Tax=Rickettsiales endosymbiont of Stachyamoeba lipophora TaxID=2486578 RepID=UPI000F649CD2|nr:peptidoglycan DD-metalloendopeptidase family protein [Rickettsiales endosymbiont of Stachyamoeba lipophora]AZL15837.1 M23 family peptidase [Rickettsiales endosymbiont of Stachyamoeba lipophora]
MLRVATLSLRTKVWVIYSVLITAILISLVAIHNLNDAAIDEHLANNVAEENENILNFTVQNGDNFASILKKNYVEDNDAAQIIKALKNIYNPARMSIGQNISLYYENYLDQNEDNKKYLNAIKISVSPSKAIEILRTQDGAFEAKEVTIQLERYLAHVSSEIESNLFATAQESEVPGTIINQVTKLLSYDIDFQREIKKGDSFSVVYETFYDQNGNFAMHGKPLYMAANVGGREIKLYYYENKNGDSDYFTEEGRSIKKELLKTPINAARISSGFGMRKHPILGYSKMHKGVDFAAPIGTPIYAAGDGVIDKVGRVGAYGNYVKIKHAVGNYSTAYGHLSRFSKGLKKGLRVKQGEIIGFVGSTGRATGPHLHYEVLLNDKHINPTAIKLGSKMKLAGQNLKQFKDYTKIINNKILVTPSRTETASKLLKWTM